MPQATPQQSRRAVARAGSGKALSLDETEALLWARGDDLRRLMRVASGLRDLGHGRTVTYSRKVFIPLTMLCRDHCHYCTFAKPPARLDHPFLTPDEVVGIAEAGRKMGCKEALFTLGDRPEERYDVARRWLSERGYGSTLEYLRAVAIRVIEETGLLPHLNPGVMSGGGRFRAAPGRPWRPDKRSCCRGRAARAPRGPRGSAAPACRRA